MNWSLRAPKPGLPAITFNLILQYRLKVYFLATKRSVSVIQAAFYGHKVKRKSWRAEFATSSQSHHRENGKEKNFKPANAPRFIIKGFLCLTLYNYNNTSFYVAVIC